MTATATTIIILLLLSLSLALLPTAHQSSIALRMTGQQLSANGTGIAYFDDGTTQSFRHTITPNDSGYFYDNSTVFVVGEIPGYEDNKTILALNDPSTGGTLGSTGDIITITIPYGADLLGERKIQPSSIINAKVGDVIIFKNEDYNVHSIKSPPRSYGSDAVPIGANFDFVLSSGQNATLVLSKPVGMHYQLEGKQSVEGAIIVEER